VANADILEEAVSEKAEEGDFVWPGDLEGERVTAGQFVGVADTVGDLDRLLDPV